MPYTGGGYQTTAKSAPIRNNGGTVLFGGNISATSPITQVLGSSTLGYHSGSNGSILRNSVPTAGTYGGRFYKTAISGNFGVMTPRQYIIRRYTSQIAGNTTSVLSSGASDFGRLPYAGRVSNRIRTSRIISTGGWVYQTGKPVVRFGVGDFGDVLNAETFPTRAIPGKLTYLSAGKTLTRTNYPAKTT
jgi:hypothetical protein